MVLGRAEAGDGACECSGGFSGAWRCRSCSADLDGLLWRRPETVQVLEATAVLGRCWAEVLELRWCLGSNPGGSEGSGAQQRVAEHRRRRSTIAAELECCTEALKLILTS